tara:strand:+ start:11048 stop:12616 length:1569 start_codon:yes stop_codon:yes gene_type:complete
MLLTAIFLIPLLAVLPAVAIPRIYGWLTRFIALLATFTSMVLSVYLLFTYDGATASPAGYKFDFNTTWVSLESIGLNIGYHVGVDGINLGLVVMGAIVAFAAACCSREIRSQEKEYYILLLLMTGGILGAFVSLDLFLFYFFHELALVPTFIMIGLWGRGEKRTDAAFNITVYLSFGALIALIGLVMLYIQTGAQSFDIVELTAITQSNPIEVSTQGTIFALLMFGLGILVSLWPFHTWAPQGYAHAPTATAMLHAGVLKKFGLYGLIRVAIPLAPKGAATWLDVLALLCVGNIIYCGLVAIRQRDINYLIGTSSVAHMGFVFLGVASLTLIGMTGAVILMVAHGLLAALTFGLSGWIRSKTGTTEIDKLGGLLKQVPFIGTALIMAMMAGCGLPGFGNFVGEFMVLFGSWGTYPVITGLAIWGALIVGAVYMLRAIRNVAHGPLDEHHARLRDADGLSRIAFSLLIAGLLVLGIYPRILTDKIKPSVGKIVTITKAHEKEIKPSKAKTVAVNTAKSEGKNR